MLLLLIYEILVDLALPIAADAATRASVATLAAAATVTAAAANGLVSSKSRRGYFAAVLSSSLTLFHSYSLATIRLLYCTWPSSLFVRGSRSVKLTCFSAAASARLLQARRGRRPRWPPAAGRIYERRLFVIVHYSHNAKCPAPDTQPRKQNMERSRRKPF